MPVMKALVRDAAIMSEFGTNSRKRRTNVLIWKSPYKELLRLRVS